MSYVIVLIPTDLIPKWFFFLIYNKKKALLNILLSEMKPEWSGSLQLLWYYACIFYHKEQSYDSRTIYGKLLTSLFSVGGGQAGHGYKVVINDWRSRAGVQWLLSFDKYLSYDLPFFEVMIIGLFCRHGTNRYSRYCPGCCWPNPPVVRWII